MKQATAIEGMTSEGGLAIMDVFLRQALETKPDSLCFEFGTYKGRTAALILQAVGDHSWLHAVDPSNYLETDKLDAMSDRYTWHKEKSESFCVNRLADVLNGQKIIYSHHDASHFFDNVKSELSGILPYLEPEAVLVLDDFNDSYSQVRAAYYYLRYVERFPFELLVIGFNKAVLVHESRFDEMEKFVLEQIHDVMEGAGLICKLSRTDINESSRNFFLAPRAVSDSRLYGKSFFGDMFYGLSREFLNEKLKTSSSQS